MANKSHFFHKKSLVSVKIIFPNKRKSKNSCLKEKTLGGYTQQTKPNQESKWMKMNFFWKIIIIIKSEQ
jgi:hypothetical protein